MPTIIKADSETGLIYSADGSGILELQSTAGVIVAGNNQGAFVIPAGTTAQRPVNPTNGMLRYNTTVGFVEIYKDGTWSDVSGRAVGGGSDQIFWLNDTVVTTSYTIPAGKNAVTAGPVTVNDGVTITVSDNSVWTVV
jgi:hypothetical protein